MAVSLVALFFTVLAVLVFFLVPLLLSSKKLLPQRSNGRRLPPSPPGLPLLGHLHLLGSLPHRSLRALAASYGPIMLLRLGRVPAVVVSSAAAVEEALKTRDLAFASRPRLLMAERLMYGCDMAFAPYGEYWRQARRVCVLHLLSPRRILSFRGVREQEVAALMERVRVAASRAPSAAAVNLSDLLISYTNAVISRAAFGDEYYVLDGDDGADKLRKLLDDLKELLVATPMAEVLPWLGWVDTLTGLEAKARRTFEALDRLLERVITDHRHRRRRQRMGDGEDGHRDLVDVLLDVNKMDEEAGIQLDTVNIKAIIVDIFTAATDTSYTILGWAMAELINHPNEMRTLQHKIRTAVACTGQPQVTEDHLDEMPYLKAVVKETLRLHPPAPLLLPREAIEDTELLGYHIPARTRLFANVWAIGRDPSTWERAEEFVPERFAAAPEYTTVAQDFVFLPLGAGRRGCPGAGFAAPTTELALANLLYHFDWELPGGRSRRQKTPTTLDMSEFYGLSVGLKATLLLVAKPWFG